MKKIYHVIEIDYTKKGVFVFSFLKCFFDGEDKYGVFKTGREKAYGYLEYLEENTKHRTYDVTSSSYGLSLGGNGYERRK